MTIADICRAWDRPSYVHGDVQSTHTVTRRFREGDRTPGTVEHVLMKFQPYLQRYANTFYPKHPDEAEEAYVDFVLAIMKRPYLFNKDLGTATLRSFVFQSYRNKLRDVLKRKNRWLARASRAAERTLELCRLQKSSEQRAVERGLALSHRIFILGFDAETAFLMGVTEGDRSVWKSYWEDGMTEAGIAATLNLSVNAVSARILKVKAYLRQQTLERLKDA